MADKRTLTALARRRRGKWLAAGAAGATLGLGLKLAFGTQLIESFSDKFKVFGEIFPGAKLWLEAHPEVAGWIAGPVMLALVFLGFAALPAVRALLDRLWPDPPPFVRSSLDELRERNRAISLEGPPRPFVGREDALAELDAFLVGDARPFAWRILTGTSGIGKTRLCVEWLARARARGWDVGFVDPDDSRLVKQWSARRPTALVVDDARRDWDDRLGALLAELSNSATPSRPVRVLLADQVSPGIENDVGSDRDAVKAGQAAALLRLRSLSDAEIARLCTIGQSPAEDRAAILRESAGRPRAALILMNARDATSYAAALKDWAERAVPGLADPHHSLSASFIGPLFLAALAGPLETDLARELFETVDVEALQRFYSEHGREELEERLPALTPDDLSEELLLRLFPRLDKRLRERALDRVISAMPTAVEWRLGAIWRGRKELSAALSDPNLSSTLGSLQARFDAACPERAGRAEKDALMLANTVIDQANDPLRVEDALATLADIADARPFDPAIRLAEVAGAVNAIKYYGAREASPALEHWGERLLQIVADDRFSASVAFRKYVAIGCVNAMIAYGGAEQFLDLERWGKAVASLTCGPQADTDLEVKCQQVRAAGCAMLSYGDAGKFEDLERWGKGLADIADEKFASCREIALAATEAGINATYTYGAVQNPEKLEHWGKYVVQISASNHFLKDEKFRLQEIRAALNVIQCYCKIGQNDLAKPWEDRVVEITSDPQFSFVRDIRLFEAKIAVNIICYANKIWDLARLNKWCARLIDVVERSESSEDLEIRLEESKGAVNAMQSYGSLRHFDELEKWGQRLNRLSGDDRFSSSAEPSLLEARGALNASLCYGMAQDFDGLERWAKRILELVKDVRFEANTEMRAYEAQCAMNATRSYGECRQIEGVERWAKRLTALGDDERFARNLEIRRNEAIGVFNANVVYARAARQDWPRAAYWRGRLAQLSREWPSDPEIQSLAAEFGLSAVSQLSGPASQGRRRTPGVNGSR